MADVENENRADSALPRRRGRLWQTGQLSLLVVIGYGLVAYLLLPTFWTHYEHQKRLAGLPMVTRTAQGIPGDPINVGLIGDSRDVLCAMQAAGWYPADPVTLRSSIAIVGSVLLDRPYRAAPVSSLYYLGRREDLAFEKPDGRSADRRHSHPRRLLSIRRFPNSDAAERLDQSRLRWSAVSCFRGAEPGSGSHPRGAANGKMNAYDLGGTEENRATRPSSRVGCVKTASRNAV